MIYWAPLLHFYQPYIQSYAVLDKICNECYRPLLKVLKENNKAKITVNICGVLSELLKEHGAQDIIDDIKLLGRRKQIEFTGSSKFHALLPLIPLDEIRRQIILNQDINKEIFGSIYKETGFFPPEMAYSKKVAVVLSKEGYEWVILSGVACNKEWPVDKVYLIRDTAKSLKALFRDDVLSNRVSFKNTDAIGFLKHLNSMSDYHKRKEAGSSKDIYVITAMDAETFGHHIKNWENDFLKTVFDLITISSGSLDSKSSSMLSKCREENIDLNNIVLVNLSEIVSKFSSDEDLEPRQSSWSTTWDDIKAKNYYPLWNNPHNIIHKYLWEHLNVCIDVVKKADELALTNESIKGIAKDARNLLDRAMFSCQWWWASRSPMWDVKLINEGLLSQEEALFTGYKVISSSNLSEVKKRIYYNKLVVARDIANKIRDIMVS